MKTLVLTTVFTLASLGAFAAETSTPAAPKAKEAPHHSTMMTKAQAKKDCKAEGRKGKDFGACVKEKLSENKS